MEKYQILECSADVKIKAFGKDQKEVLSNSMLALEEVSRPKLKNFRVSTEISIKSEDLNGLLFDFLSEINYLNEVNREVYNRIYFKKLLETEMEAELYGSKVKRFGLQIKGVTMRGLEIGQKQNGQWEAAALLDI